MTGDWITVGELTPFEISVWKFPNTKICPLRSCALVCETRDLTIKHYKEEHAKHSALCKICKYPLMLLKGAHHFLTHFARKHPGMPAPLKVKDFQVKIQSYLIKMPLSFGRFNIHRIFLNRYSVLSVIHSSKHFPHCKIMRKNFITKSPKIRCHPKSSSYMRMKSH